MKLKNWVLWLCVAALLATEVFLFRAKSQKDAAIVQLNESQHKVAQLQSDLDQLKNSSVATLSTENARLRAENQGLTQKFAQLQNEINQSRQQNQKLTQQVETAHNTLQQQQEQLQAMQAENQQAATATEATAEQSMSPAAQLNTCINNLRQIDAAKQQWALENDKTADAIPSAQDLLPYLSNLVFPVCPSGGTYTINAVGVPPTCSVPGHVLPQ
ncbi:MAG: cell division protein ZapB [Verrucomicrobiota bacterium]